MKLGVTLDILNQKATPAFYADTLANRPAAGFTGRVFISTDTLDLYRDTGTTWVLLSPSSTGTITGSGAAGQVTYFSAASSITGSNNLFWDATNNRLGVNTNAPTATFDVHGTTNIIAQLNQLTTGQNALLTFQDNSVGKWRLGNIYNAAANDFGIVDITNSLQRLTIKNTGQTFIGTETTSSGLFVVNSSASDNHIVAIGANAPSIRINNAGTGATRQIGIGLATAVNNFIQGANGGDMAIFNSNTTASPILFGIYDGTNTQEAARISASRNLLVGQTADTGQTLQVTGSASITGITQFSNTGGAFSGFPAVTINQGGTGIALSITKISNNEALYINKSGTGNAATILGNVGIGASSFTSPSGADTILGVYGGQDCSLILQDAVQLWELYVNDDFYINRGSTNVLTALRSNGNVGINTSTPNGKLQIYLDSITAGNAPAASGTTPVNAMLNLTNNRGIGMYFGGSYAGNYGQWIQVSDTGNLGVNYPLYLNPNGGNLLIGTTTDNGSKLQVNGNITSNSAVKFGTYGYSYYAYGNVNNMTKTVTINNTGLNGTLQINVGVYNNGAGSNSQAVWFCGGYGGAGMLATEITRTNGASTTISAITSNVNSLTFTINSTGSSDVNIVVLVGDINNNIVTITIA